MTQPRKSSMAFERRTARSSWRRFLPLLLPLLLPSLVAADGGERPKVGIAFGGGGAKGGAHLGVLLVLEEMRIPVDYVAGTSMGSIMGGLYASGMSPEEMKEALFRVDWDDAMRDQTSRQDLSFRRKEDSQRYLLDLEVGVKKSGLEWPAGLLSGQKLFFHLQALTLPVADVDDFDRLPIPFRAVATDIQVGEPVVLAKGNLAMAMRASMAIPTVFSPVVLDGRLLVDGGVTNNLPVDVVRAMGADVVIAIDLGAPLESRKVNSLLQIQNQTSRMLVRKNMEPQLAAADIVLHPTVSHFGTLNFAALQEIFEAGVAEARAKEEELRPLAVSAAEYREYQERHRRQETPPSILDGVRIVGNERIDGRIIEDQIRMQAGDSLDFDKLSEDLGRIYGLGHFKQVSFFLDRGGGKNVLVIDLHEKLWGPNYLHFGFNLATDIDGDFRTSFLVNLLKTGLNARGGEIRTDLLVGKPRELTSELYQPLDFDGRWFLSATAEVGVRPTTFFADDKAIAETDLQRGQLRLEVGVQSNRTAEIRLGIVRGRGSVKITSGSLPYEDLSDVDFAGVRLLAQVDRLDDVEFPRAGASAFLQAFASREDLGADFEYETVEGRWLEFWSWRSNTIFAGLGGGWASEDTPFWAELSIGGLTSFSGFPDDALRGRFYGVARLGFYREVWRNKLFGGWLEAGNMWDDVDQADLDDLIHATTLFAGARTRIGPVYLGYGRAGGNRDKLYLIVGRRL